MRCYLFIFVLSILLSSSLVFGAHFVYESSSMWAQSQSTAIDSNSTDDSGTAVDWKSGDNDTDVYVSTSAMTEEQMDATAYCDAYSTMQYSEYYDEEGSLYLYAWASAYAETYVVDATAVSYAGAAGVAPGYSTGLFFKIMPDDGELEGDTVEITMQWYGEVSVNNTGIARSDAGFLGNDDPGSGITVALNPSDKVIPPASSRVWERDMLEQFVDGSQNESDQITFTAKIGDVIGVFAGVHAEVEVADEGNNGSVEAGHEFTFYLEYMGKIYTAADADIDGNGIVGFGDLAVLAQFWLQNVVEWEK